MCHQNDIIQESELLHFFLKTAHTNESFQRWEAKTAVICEQWNVSMMLRATVIGINIDYTFCFSSPSRCREGGWDFINYKTFLGSRDSWLVRARIPAGAAREFSSPESALCADSYSVSVPPQSLPKCRWQVTPTHAYTFDLTKSEWADYASVQA